MSKFTSEDLAFSGYAQTIDLSNSNKLVEIQSSIYINKIEEYEVINFCNQFLKSFKVPRTRASFQKVETFLQHNSLENEAHKERLADWIASNWIKL